MKGRTRIQESYLIGASMEQDLGGVPGHVYLECRGTGIDLDKLRQAWREVLHLHGIDTPLNRYVACFDCAGLPQVEAEREITQYRGAFAQRNTRTETGHSCGLALFRLPGGVDSLHFDLNLQVADPAGFQILLGQLAQRYQGHPVTLSPEGADASQEPASLADVAYWKAQVEQMRPGPILEQLRNPARMHHCRYQAAAAKLDAAQWGTVQERAAKLGVLPTTLAMAAFADTLRAVTQEDFLLNLPVFHAEGSGVESPERIADRTRLLTLAVRKTDQLADLFQRYQAGMEHIRLDGLEVQAMLRERYPEEHLLAPTVFSATPGVQLVTEAFQASFGALTYLVSQTPQVCLDAQIYELWDGAYLAWMTPEGLYEDTEIQRLFQQWIERLLEESKKGNNDERNTVSDGNYGTEPA